MDIPRTIPPDTIRQIRGSKTQSEFAEQVGVSSFVQVSRWENGMRPSRVFRKKLAELAAKRHIPIG